MSRARLVFRLVLAIAAAGIVSTVLWRNLFKPRVPSLEEGDFGAVSDFHLVERDGRAVSLADLKGKTWVADFVFTRCMGPCPLLSKTMAGLQREFSPLDAVRLVSFSVDPGHDTPDVLKGYAATFGADRDRWLFLTGDTDAVHALVLGSFKSALQDNGPSRPGEEVTHSLHFVLVDKNGRIRGYFDGTDAAALVRLGERVRALL